MVVGVLSTVEWHENDRISIHKSGDAAKQKHIGRGNFHKSRGKLKSRPFIRPNRSTEKHDKHKFRNMVARPRQSVRFAFWGLQNSLPAGFESRDDPFAPNQKTLFPSHRLQSSTRTAIAVVVPPHRHRKPPPAPAIGPHLCALK